MILNSEKVRIGKKVAPKFTYRPKREKKKTTKKKNLGQDCCEPGLYSKEVPLE
jgi:hypothetical protein